MISHNLVYPTKHERWIMNLNWGLLRIPPHFESPIYQAQENSQKLWDLKEDGFIAHPTILGQELSQSLELIIDQIFDLGEFLLPTNSSPDSPWTSEQIKVLATRNESGLTWTCGGGEAAAVSTWQWQRGPSWSTEEAAGCVKRILVRGN